MTDEFPWVKLQDVCHMYGLTLPSARNAIRLRRFPVETYKVGKHWVIDHEVHRRFFEGKRETGLRALVNNKK